MTGSRKSASGQRFYLATVEYDSGKLFHMWTSLLHTENLSPDTKTNEATLLRFRCFTRKLSKDVDVRSAKLLKISAVKTAPGRIGVKKLTVTDVLNYRDRSMRKPASGTVYIWGKLSTNQFTMIRGPLAVNSKSNPEFFPKY